MPDTTSLSEASSFSALYGLLVKSRVWLASGALLIAIALIDLEQASQTALFGINALIGTAPYLIASIAVAAWAAATGADNLIARAFTGSPAMIILLAALAGGLSPFCSCGVIPLIAALLAMGVPLSAIMAFWLSSPIIDPSMFVLTVGLMDLEFAIAKTLAAVGLGLFGGSVVHFTARAGAWSEPLREGVSTCGCSSVNVTNSPPVAWRFWEDAARRATFVREALSTTLFLTKWLVLAFLLESLLSRYVPAETVTSVLGGNGAGAIAMATLVGVPAYLNGYAALPLVGGLIDQGMAPGAGLAFLVAGGVTSIPAALAVWALVKLRVFALYIALSLSGAFMAGALFQLWVSL